ncbi:hypothetical protein G4B88_018523, partial [Cannabis sativa]
MIHKSHLLSSQILTAAPHHELERRLTSLSASPACLPPPAASLLFFVVDKCSCCCGTGARLGRYVACSEVLPCVPSNVSSAQAIIKLIKWIQRRRGLESEEA